MGKKETEKAMQGLSGSEGELPFIVSGLKCHLESIVLVL
jgi:hypothetical protein